MTLVARNEVCVCLCARMYVWLVISLSLQAKLQAAKAELEKLRHKDLQQVRACMGSSSGLGSLFISYTLLCVSIA